MVQIAIMELREKKIPFTVRRYLPDGRYVHVCNDEYCCCVCAKRSSPQMQSTGSACILRVFWAAVTKTGVCKS